MLALISLVSRPNYELPHVPPVFARCPSVGYLTTVTARREAHTQLARRTATRAQCRAILHKVGVPLLASAERSSVAVITVCDNRLAGAGYPQQQQQYPAQGYPQQGVPQQGYQQGGYPPQQNYGPQPMYQQGAPPPRGNDSATCLTAWCVMHHTSACVTDCADLLWPVALASSPAYCCSKAACKTDFVILHLQSCSFVLLLRTGRNLLRSP